MGSSIRHSVRRGNKCRDRRLVSDCMIDRGSDNATTEEGDRRTWELVGRLVQIDNSDPGTYEDQIEQRIYEWFTKGTEEKVGTFKNQIELVQREAIPGRFNLMIRISGKEQAPAPALMHIHHMDTVTPGEGWEEETPVLGAVVEEGRLYGRGTCDMKSGLVCAMSAFSDMVELARSTGELPARLFAFIGTVDEEDFMQGVESAVRDGWVDGEDWTLDMEPTDGQIRVAHKGRTRFELAIQGITAYVSNPWKGADTIVAMAEAVSRIRKAIGSCSPHEDLGMSTVTFGQIIGGYRPYTVPGSCKVWIDMCLVSPMDTAAAKNIVKEAVRAIEAEIVGVRGSCLITGDRPYTEKNSSSRPLANFKSVYGHVTGEDTLIGSFNGYTDTVAIAETLGNCNYISYSPGSLEPVHKLGGYVPYEDVCRYRRVLIELARQEAFFPFAL